jgi:hypothetical protein
VSAGNGWDEYKRSVIDGQERQEAAIQRLSDKVDALRDQVVELRTQRNGLAWVIGPGVGAAVSALVMLAWRKLGL